MGVSIDTVQGGQFFGNPLHARQYVCQPLDFELDRHQSLCHVDEKGFHARDHFVVRENLLWPSAEKIPPAQLCEETLRVHLGSCARRHYSRDHILLSGGGHGGRGEPVLQPEDGTGSHDLSGGGPHRDHIYRIFVFSRPDIVLLFCQPSEKDKDLYIHHGEASHVQFREEASFGHPDPTDSLLPALQHF